MVDMKYVPGVVNRIAQCPDIVIFGAGIVAREVAGVLTGEPYCFSVSCFMVSETRDNPSSISGIPVIRIEEAPDKLRDNLIIVAAMEKSLSAIQNNLYRNGFFNILPLTFECDIWSELRGNSFRLWYEKIIGKAYVDIDEVTSVENYLKNELNVYRAVSHFDKAIYENIDEFSWEKKIQVGRSLTETIICDLNDALGDDNISEKNKRFCELTALYWIWKNDKSRYKGLCHYRRHFILDEEKRNMLTNSDIDVVLTIPIFNTPDVYSVFAHDHFESDWKIMMEELQRQQPRYVKTAEMLSTSTWYYAYNMFIAKSEIFDDYCSFLFPILFACEERIGNRDDRYQGRYIGFLAERLMSIYFMAHKEYNIVHCRKHFIGA